MAVGYRYHVIQVCVIALDLVLFHAEAVRRQFAACLLVAEPGNQPGAIGGGCGMGDRLAGLCRFGWVDHRARIGSGKVAIERHSKESLWEAVIGLGLGRIAAVVTRFEEYRLAGRAAPNGSRHASYHG